MFAWLDTLAGRTLALLFGMGIVFTVGSAILFYAERHEQFDRNNQFHFAKRVAVLASLLNDANQEDQSRIIDKFSAPGNDIYVAAKPLIARPHIHPIEHMLSHKLRRALGLSDKTAVFVKLNMEWEDDDDDREYGHHRYIHDVESIIVSIRLWDESWLNIETENFAAPPPWAGKTLQLFAFFMVLLVVSSLFIARRMSRPMIKLGQAAERLGLGQPQAPLPEKGPKEVRQTIQAFNQMQERLQKQISDRSLMLAAVSHDLRTPITTLRLRAEYIEDEDIRSKTLATLAEMEAILSATLSFARDEAADEQVRETNLAALIQSLVDDHKDLGGDISYLGPDKLIYRCRPVSLRRAINNVLENALRYADAAEVSLVETETGILIIVADEGPGIPEDKLSEVCTPFYRLEASRNKSTGGTGLGLAVTKSIVLAHGGEITLANRKDVGLQTTLMLPKQTQ